MGIISKEVVLLRYPVGMPVRQDFAMREIKIDESLAAGQVLVKNLFMSVDPYMRGRMSGRRSYVDPCPIGEPLTGSAIGQVVRSAQPELPVGTLVASFSGWREYFVAKHNQADLIKLPALEGLSPSVYLGTLGMPGQTAYVGLLHIAGLQKGQRVFVSAAAGAVGSLVGQIARSMGCYVVGSCGSDEKASYLHNELGFDHVINYKRAPIKEQLAAVAGAGFDVYFDNVGGDHLGAALDQMRDFGRIALCGAISQYNLAEPVPGPSNLMQIVAKRLKLQGFIVSDHDDKREAFLRDMSGWLKSGKIRDRQTQLDGIDHAVEAFLGLFSGKNVGKMVVKL